MITAVIIDDELNNRGFLKGLVDEYCPDVKLQGEANSVETGLSLINRVNPELVFLDVELGDGNAFDLLAQLPEKKFNVIFTTAFDHYAFRAIKFSAIDYLLKPINSIELKAAVEKIKLQNTSTLLNNMKMLMTNFSSATGKAEKIALPTFDGHIFIKLDDIIRFEAESNYTYVFTADGNKITVSKTLKDFEDFIDPNKFVRIHNSHIINLLHVKRYIKGRGGSVIMDDGSKAMVSKRKKEEFLHKMNII